MIFLLITKSLALPTSSHLESFHPTNIEKLANKQYVTTPSSSSVFSHLDAPSPYNSIDYISVTPTQKLKTELSNDLSNTSNPISQQTTIPASSKKYKVKSNGSQRTSRASQKLSTLFTPEIFSKDDSFQNLIAKIWKSSKGEIIEAAFKLDTLLKNNQIPEMYMPHARALESIIRAQISLFNSKRFVQEIQKHQDRSKLPPEVSSPEVLSDFGLFSSHIFYDPNYPKRLINTLIEIPKKDIPYLITELENYTKISKDWGHVPSLWWRYIWYAKEISSFLYSGSVLDDLKRNMAEIERILTSRQDLTTAREDN